MKLILVRHGETDANKNGIIQGVDDNKLNNTGIKQAKEVGKELKKKYKIDMVFCSPLVRCVETLNNILEEYLIEGEIFMCKLIEERDFGEYTGVEEKNINEKELNQKNKLTEEMGVEDIESLKKRSQLFLEDLKLEDENKTILVISHHGPIRMMINKLTGKNVDDIKVENGKILEFDIDN